MPHLDEGQLHALLDGELDSAELVTLEAHLAGCAVCQAELTRARAFLAEADDLIRALDTPAPAMAMAVASGAAAAPTPAPRQPTAPSLASGPVRARPPSRWTRALASAAIVVFALGIGWAGRDRWEARHPGPAPVALAVSEPTPDTLADRRMNEVESAPAPKPATPARSSGTAGNQPAKAAKTAPTKVTAQNEARQDAVEEKGKAAESSKPDQARPSLQARIDTSRRIELSEVVVTATPERQAQPPAATALRKRSQDRRAEGFVAAAPPGAVLTPITADSALQFLRGQIRLIDGLVPSQFLSDGHRIRVSYQTSWGPLHLDQWREGEEIRFELFPPTAMSRDSVAVLRTKIR